MLKRGWASTIEEWLQAAEYIASQGNYEIILCERGIRTFENYTRNTFDINAIAAIKELSHLPVFRRSFACHGQAQSGQPGQPRRGGDRRRRPDPRNPPESGKSPEGRPAVALLHAVRKADGGCPAHCAGGRKTIQTVGNTR